MKDKVFCFDIDGVIFKDKPGADYTEVEPIQENIDLINAVKATGAKVVLYTARGSKTGIDWKYVTTLQLLKYDVRYDELLFGKPYYDYYVDDKNTTMEQLRERLNGKH
jgi:CMP-N,N'-diacetyllegionaminic acid synthase